MASFGFGGFSYLIIATQLFSGFPPFYRRWVGFGTDDFERDFKRFAPILFGAAIPVILTAATGQPAFLVLTGLISFYGGYRVRRELSQTVDGPLPWITNIWISKWPIWSVRHPMLVFDLWTLSLTALVVFAAA
jgi:hypothetical protein